MAVRVRQGAVNVQRRYFRPQGIAIPDEHMPPLEGTKAFDSEVNDYYTLRLNQSFWRKDLSAKFMSTSARESLRRRVHERQAHFDTIKLMTVHEKEEEGQIAIDAASLITQRFNEPAPPKAPFAQGDRILPHSGPMKHQPATVLGYRDGLLWLQHDIHASPVPHHPSRLRSGWSLISRCKVADELPEATDTHITLNTGSPVHMPKVKEAEDNDLKGAEEADKAAQVPKAEVEAGAATEGAEPKAEETKTEEPKTEEPKAEESKIEEPKAEEVKAAEPQTEEPKAEEPKVEEPKVEEPKAKEPNAKEPKVEEESKAEEPKAEEPKAEELKSEEPKAEDPKAAEPTEAEEPKTEERKAEEPEAEEPKAEEPKAEEPKAEEPKAEPQSAPKE